MTGMENEADAAAGAAPKSPQNTKSKRQMIKALKESDKNRWPQHPNIKSAEARAKAYIRTAGLGERNAETTRQHHGSSTVNPELDVQAAKLGRLLGGTDQNVRHRALLQLQGYLKARCDGKGISELDLLKLWKALWFTLYMADKVPVQDAVSEQIVQLLWCLEGTEEEDEYAAQAYMQYCDEEDAAGDILDMDDDEAEEGNEREFTDDDDYDDDDEEEEEEEPEVTIEEIVNTLHDGSDSSGSDVEDSREDSEDADIDLEDSQGEDDMLVPHCRGAHLVSLFVRTFFSTIQREWGNMDKYRVDKFYTLCRLMLNCIFQYMAKRLWSPGIIRLFNDAIYQEVLSKTPNGLRLHLIDIVVAELAHVNASKAPLPLTEATFIECLEPYFAMAQGILSDPIVQKRVVENVLERFLLEYSVVSDKAIMMRRQGGNVTSGKDDQNSLIMDQVHVETVAEFIFALASEKATRDSVRKGLYDLHKAYMKRIKLANYDVSLDSQDYDSDKDETVDAEDDEMDCSDERNDNKRAAEQCTGCNNANCERSESKVENPPTLAETKSIQETSVSEKDDSLVGTKKKRKKRKKNKKNQNGQTQESLAGDVSSATTLPVMTTASTNVADVAKVCNDPTLNPIESKEKIRHIRRSQLAKTTRIAKRAMRATQHRR